MSTTARRPILTPARRTEQAQWPSGQRGSAPGRRAAAQPPAVAPPTVQVPEPVLSQRRQSQRLVVALIVFGAVFSVVMGTLYLSGYASLQFELNRRVKLQSQLRAAEERSKLYQEHMARVNSNEYIEQEAEKAHMVLADDKQTVTLDTTK